MSAFSNAVDRVVGQQQVPPPVVEEPAAPQSAFQSAVARTTQKREGELAPRAERRAALEAEYGAEEYSALSDSDFNNFISGIGSGMTNVARNVGNVIPGANAITKTLFGFDVSDEAIAEQRSLDQELGDTKSGMAGQFAGEVAALAPLGSVGAVTKLGGAATKLPTAMKVLAATGEGALAGSLLADPNERGTGALIGGTGGAALNRFFAGGSRVFKDGLAKMRAPAQEAIDYVQKSSGKRMSLPLTIAGDSAAGGTSAKASSYGDVISHIPSSKGAVDRQIGEASMDLFEADLRHAFQRKPVADAAVKVLRETGDMQKAIEAGKRGSFTNKQSILDQAARQAPEGRYTGRQLLKSAEEHAGDGDLTNAPFRDIANNRMKLLPRGEATPAGQSTVFSRDAARGLGDLLGRAVDLVPGPWGSILASKSVQNFVVGNTRYQRLLQKAVASKDGQKVRSAISAIRTAMAGQLPPNEDAGFMGGVTQNLLDETTGFLGAQ